MAATSKSVFKRSSKSSSPLIEPLEGRRLLSGGGEAVVSETVLASSDPSSNPQLINAWGISYGPTTPIWISENGSSQAQLYNAAGVKQALTVSIPSADTNNPSAPTGQVFNGDATAFKVPTSPTTSASAKFIFAGEDGGISGWAGGSAATLEVNQFSMGTVFKGLAINTLNGQSTLYVTDFHNGQVDVFNASWGAVHLPGGAFTDHRIPKGYAPFGIQSIGSNIYVTYAKQDDKAHDDVAGAGHGFVDEFDTSGHLIQHFQRVRALNSPWGVTQAPATWGELSGDILVGQFGSGMIAAYRPDGRFDQVLQTSAGKPLVIDGLWGLTFGGGAANNGSTSTLFFTAGPNGESGGLFGTLTATVTPDTGRDHDHDADDRGPGRDHGHDKDHDDDGDMDILDQLMADLDA